jgi:YHS domain-containing protein
MRPRLLLLLLSLAVSVVHAAGLDGRDPISYFTSGQPTKGSEGITADYRGETYRFSSTENRAVFVADPEKYLPQYGGYCAYAVAKGQLAPGDPAVFKVVDGKLYLNVNRSIAERWQQDIPGFIRSADTNWPKIKK